MRIYPALDLDWPERPDEDHLERVIAEIDDQRPTAVTERERGVRLFFPNADFRGRAAAILAAVDPHAACTPVDVPDDNWAERSQADLKPVTIGALTITPRDRDITPGVNSQLTPGVIFIRPSMGFGTGHHASTRLCLGLLQRVPLGGRRVLDVGTGSGVLAIAAARLGAASAVGIDHDPDALAAAQDGVDMNGEGARVTLAAVDLVERPVAGAPFDVVLANLTGALLTRESDRLARCIDRGGHLIVSGFMLDEDAVVTHTFERIGLRSVDQIVEDGWVGRLFTSPSAPTGPQARPSAPTPL